MDEGALLELEQRVSGVASLVLADGVPNVLVRHRVLQLDRRDRETVKAEHEVNGIVPVWDELHLACHDEAVLAVAVKDVRVQAVRRSKVGNIDLLAVELEAVADNNQACPWTPGS